VIKRLTGLFIPLSIGCGLACAQNALQCAPSTAVSKLVLSEGLAEPVGDIVLACSGGTAGAHVIDNLAVFLNVNITNRVSANNLADAQLTVDTGTGPVPAGIFAPPVGLNGLAFNGISFTIPASRQVSFRISNVRADASQLGPTPQQRITALLSSNTLGITSPNAQFTVAMTQTGLLAEASSSEVRCNGSPLPSSINLPNLFATGTRFDSTRVTEGFASAFRPKDAFSDAGTRVMVRYSGFPSGARLFVPEFVAGSSAIQQTAGGGLGLAASGGQYAPNGVGSLLLVRVNGADQNGAGGGPAFPTPGIATAFNSVSEIALTNGAGNVVYEVVDANPSVRESAQFPTFLGLGTYSGQPVVAHTTLSLAPLSTVETFSQTAPVPRYAEVTPQSDCATLGDCNAGYFPSLDVGLYANSAALTFNVAQNAQFQYRYIGVRNTGGGVMDWTVSISYQNGSGWLSVAPQSGTNNATIRLDAHPDKVAAGTYQATLTIDAGPLAGSRSLPVTLTVTRATPTVTVSSVVNAASFAATPLAPGSLATIQGNNLAGQNVSVTFDSVPATLLYTGATQINLQVPEQLAGKTSAQLIVTADGRASAPQTVQLTVVSPAIFTNGILNQNSSLNGATKPEKPGRVIQIFATGLISPGSGGITAHIAGHDILAPYYAGPAPGIPGVQQINIRIPADVAAGNAQVDVCAVGANPNQRICSPVAPVVVTR